MVRRHLREDPAILDGNGRQDIRVGGAVRRLDVIPVGVVTDAESADQASLRLIDPEGFLLRGFIFFFHGTPSQRINRPLLQLYHTLV